MRRRPSDDGRRPLRTIPATYRPVPLWAERAFARLVLRIFHFEISAATVVEGGSWVEGAGYRFF